MAKDKGNYPDIYDELFLLRKENRPLSTEAVARFPLLTKTAGYGDPTDATRSMRAALQAHSGDRELHALWLTLTGEGSVQTRLQRAADALFVEVRRARDLSDLGIVKLSGLIASGDLSHIPLVAINLLGDDDDGLTIEFAIVSYDDYEPLAPPYFTLNGNPWNPRIVEVEKNQGRERRVYERVHNKISPVPPGVKRFPSLFVLDVIWGDYATPLLVVNDDFTAGRCWVQVRSLRNSCEIRMFSKEENNVPQAPGAFQLPRDPDLINRLLDDLLGPE